MMNIKMGCIVCMIAFMITPMLGQRKFDRRSDSKIEAWRAAYITERLGLSVDEAETLFPVYNEYNTKLKELRRNRKSDVSWDQMTEQQAKEKLEKSLGREEEKIVLKRLYAEKMSAVISYKRVLRLFKAEQEFKKEVLGRLQKKRRNN